ncbi:MAG TPA: hypothetical protein VHP37_30725 [Burkholderiales bacterium]|nr:hypothetical protein [Burkholderiales bacterium]
MPVRINPNLDPVRLRKRVLLFYFAAGINLLMALWVGSVGGSSGQASGGTVTLITLVFIGFAGLNYYMARKLQKYLRRLVAERPAVPAGEQKVTDGAVTGSAVTDDAVTKDR